MDSKERLIAALEHRQTDRLPVTTHHLMPSFLKNYMNGAPNIEFFEHFGLDAIYWPMAYKFDPKRGEYFDPEHTEMGFLEARRVMSDNWVIKIEKLEGHNYPSQRFNIVTPEKTLSMILQSDQHSTWVVEHLLKEKKDIDIIAKYMTYPLCDVDLINQKAEEFGNKGLVRGHIMAFEGFGQPGCWQDAACLFGIEKLIIATFEDPEWVHASLIEAAHNAGQRISYHTCGGMMPILEDIAAMNPDAMETFTPDGMGADVDLAEAKKRIGEKVCMIGGFDQFHFLKDCTEEETRAEVRRCFEAAGQGGGFILSPSDHFFDADLNLIHAFADEGRKCVYDD